MDPRDRLALQLAELRGLLEPGEADALAAESADPSGRLEPAALEPLRRLAGELLARKARLLAGRYDLRRLLGEGGMGKVYLARDLKLDRNVALKGLGRGGPGDLERFTREARLAAGLRHPHLVEAYDLVSDGPDHFLTMRYVEGRPLSELVADRSRPLETLVAVLAQAAEGLHHAHLQGVLHRDVKPSNILVDATDHAHLCDFGLARRHEGGTRVTRSGMILGTPAYMAPEQARAAAVDVLQHVVHDDPVPPSRLAPSTPRPLELVCLKALEKDPERRYASAADFAAELRRWLDDEPVLAAPPSAARRARRWISRHRVLSVAAVALLLLAGTGALLLRSRATIERGAAYRRLQERLAPVAATLRETRLLFYIPQVDIAARVMKAEDALAELERLAADAEAEGVAEAEPWILAGQGWYHVGDPARAEAALDRAAKLAPGDGRIPYYRGRLALERGFAAAFEPERTGSRRHGRKGWTENARALLEKAAPAEDVDRDLAAAYLALARDRYDDAARLCAEGLRRHAEALGSEEFSLIEALVLGDPDSRLAAATRALERRPHYAWGRFVRASHQADAGRLAPAIADLDLALAANPRLAPAYANRATYRQWSGDLDGAARDFDLAVKHDPAGARVYYNRGEFRRSRGELAAAEADFTIAVERDPGFADAWNHRAMVRRTRGDLDGSLADSRRAIEADPKSAVPLLVRAATHLGAGRLAEARVDLDRAEAVEPGHPETHATRGNLLAMEGKREEAVAEYTKAVESDRAMPGSYVNRGTLRSQLGDWKGALEDYAAALKLDSAYVAAWINRGLLQRDLGKLDAALADLEQGLKIDPRNPDGLNGRGVVRLARGDAAGARADYDAALASNPRLAAAWINSGALRDQQGDKQGALADYGRGLELQPGNASGWYNRGILRLELKEHDGALADLTKAIEIRPGYANALFARASVHYAMKNVRASLADVEAALAAAPPDWPKRRSAEQTREQLRRLVRE